MRLLKQGIPASVIFHDLYVKKFKDNYSQIDVVVPTKTGIIVFEVKDYSGWIFGKGYHTYWTQVLAYGRDKYRFYNPIKQNDSHCETLRKKLAPYANVPIYSVIVFYGNCVFRDISAIPKMTYIIRPYQLRTLLDEIVTKNPQTHYISKRGVIDVLQEAVRNGDDPEIQLQHIQNIQERFGN